MALCLCHSTARSAAKTEPLQWAGFCRHLFVPAHTLDLSGTVGAFKTVHSFSYDKTRNSQLLCTDQVRPILRWFYLRQEGLRVSPSSKYYETLILLSLQSQERTRNSRTPPNLR